MYYNNVNDIDTKINQLFSVQIINLIVPTIDIKNKKKKFLITLGSISLGIVVRNNICNIIYNKALKK
jgi:hypothetical protein